MVTVTYPCANSFGAVWGNLLFESASVADLLAKTNLIVSVDTDAIVGSKGIYGENDVEHWKAEGNLDYSPIRPQIVQAPTSRYPRAIVINFKVDGVAKQKSAYWGALAPGCFRVQNQATNRNPASYVAMSGSSPNTFFYLESSTFVSSYINVIRRYDVLRITSSGIEFRITSNSVSNIYTKYNLWYDNLTYEDVVGLFDMVVAAGKMGVPSYTSPQSLLRMEFNSYVTPAAISERVRLLVRQSWPDTYIVPHLNYGLLAQEASQKVRINQVNMIAFLRDLRHPTELIPKLKNLKSLKGISSTYLGTIYGILPTVGDIRSIVAAAKHVGPYLDKNGYSTYSAGYFASEETPSGVFNLQQQLKLAIAEEDNEFEALVSRIESMGFWPDLETIWDLVPYSFAIDWLVDVGGFLERVDTHQRLLRLNIRYTTMSYKEWFSLSLREFQGSLNNDLNLVHYHRWVSDQCPVPPLLLESDPTILNHWLEAGALILQRAH